MCTQQSIPASPLVRIMGRDWCCRSKKDYHVRHDGRSLLYSLDMGLQHAPKETTALVNSQFFHWQLGDNAEAKPVAPLREPLGA